MHYPLSPQPPPGPLAPGTAPRLRVPLGRTTGELQQQLAAAVRRVHEAEVTRRSIQADVEDLTGPPARPRPSAPPPPSGPHVAKFAPGQTCRTRKRWRTACLCRAVGGNGRGSCWGHPAARSQVSFCAFVFVLLLKSEWLR